MVCAYDQTLCQMERGIKVFMHGFISVLTYGYICLERGLVYNVCYVLNVKPWLYLHSF